MASISRIVNRNRSQVTTILNREGQPITRYRPAYQDKDGVWQVEDTATYQGYCNSTSTTFTPVADDVGNLSGENSDDTRVYFDHAADIREMDQLTFNGYDWIVSRWEPLKRNVYIIAQIAYCKRRGADL